VHNGHQKIVNETVLKARKKGISSLLFTFDPHPVNALSAYRKVPLLMSTDHRVRLLKEAGVDNIVVLPFTRTLREMTAENFISKIFARIRVEEVVIGENFFFGKEKKGNPETLRAYSALYGYRVSSIKALRSSGRIISSTRIRSLIISGKLKSASRLLSRPVSILGTVVRGHGRGRIIGFPTANIDPHHEAIPPSGVYAVKVLFSKPYKGKKHYKGILNIGTRPTFKGPGLYNPEPTIEVHIFKFHKFIYGKTLEIRFVRKLRDERRFKDGASLKRQIESDVKRVKRILAVSGNMAG